MKKVVLPIAMLVVGFVIGYFTLFYSLKNDIETYDKSSFVSDEGSSLSFSLKNFIQSIYDNTSFEMKSGSRPLDSASAYKYIKSFQKDNGKKFKLFPLTTWDTVIQKKVPIKGFYIGRQYLDIILHDSTNVGISFFYAKSDSADRRGGKRQYTLVYMGAKDSTNSGTIPSQRRSNNLPPKVIDNSTTSETMYDFINPCPNACGNFVTKLDKEMPTGTHKPKNK